MSQLHPCLIGAIFACAGVSMSSAVIVLGPDDSQNRVDPGDGAPWQYVAAIGNNSGSGVYLGNGYVLTAAHVTPNTPILLNDVTYSLSASIPISGADLSLLRLDGDPGLPWLPLIASTQNDLQQSSMMIGWGLGKGAEVANQGWLWGDGQTYAKRWAINATLSTLYVDENGSPYLQTAFDRTLGPNVGQLALADSGSGLFENIGGLWTLAGIGAGVDGHSPLAALYDNDPDTPGDQPDNGYYVELQPYVGAIESITGTPEPSAALLMAGGLAALGIRRLRPKRGAVSPVA